MVVRELGSFPGEDTAVVPLSKLVSQNCFCIYPAVNVDAVYEVVLVTRDKSIC